MVIMEQVIIGFVLSLLPDIKAYSDYNPDKPAYNLEESDTITTYLLKISLPTIMTILFFSLGFSGTLWQAYGNVVDAMAVAAEKVVQVDLAGYVNKALNSISFLLTQRILGVSSSIALLQVSTIGCF